MNKHIVYSFLNYKKLYVIVIVLSSYTILYGQSARSSLLNRSYQSTSSDRTSITERRGSILSTGSSISKQSISNATIPTTNAMLQKQIVGRASLLQKKNIASQKNITTPSSVVMQSNQLLQPVVQQAKSSVPITSVTGPELSSVKASVPQISVDGTLDSNVVTAIQQYFAIFPDPTIDTNTPLLPSLDNLIKIVYQDTLGLPDTLLLAIKKMYAFMQSQVFDEKLASQQEAINSLQQKIAIAQIKNDPLLSTYQSQFIQVQNSYKNAQNSLDSTIIRLCLEHSFWQKYLKSLVSASYDYEQFLLNQVYSDELQVFNFIPKFETCYYTDAFTHLRVNSEIVRIFLILVGFLRGRSLTQLNDWKSIKDSNTLYDNIQIFKKDPSFKIQETFDKAVFSTKMYPLPKDISIVDSSGNIIPGFSSFFTAAKTSNGYTIIPNSNVSSMIVVDSKTNQISLTSLGNLFLQFQPASSQSDMALVYTSTFNACFTEGPSGTHMPTPLYLMLLGLSGIKLLSNTMEYLFNTANLEATMAQLATLDNKYFTNTPLFFSYQPSDYLYLDTINFLKSGSAPVTEDTTASTMQAQTKAQGGVGEFLGGAIGTIAAAVVGLAVTAISYEAIVLTAPIAAVAEVVDLIDPNTPLHAVKEKFRSGVIGFGKSTAAATIDIGKSFAATGKAFYYDTGIACAVENISYSRAQEKASAALADLNNHLGNFFENTSGILTGATTVMKSAADVTAVSTGYVVGQIFQDKQLSEDVTGWLQNISYTMVDMTLGTATQYVSQFMGSVIQLSTAATTLACQAITSAITAPFIVAAGGTAFSGMSNLSSNFLSTTVAALIRPLKFSGRGLLNSLNDVMQTIGYLSAVILDLTIDIAGGVAALSAMTYGGNPKEMFNTIKDSINDHRRVIISSITAALLTAIAIVSTVLTGGGAAAFWVGVTFAVIGTGMMAMGAIGAHQQDEQAIIDKANQKAFLLDYQQYVIDNVLTTSFSQQLLLQEVNNDINDVLQNQERALMYYQNYLNNSINTSIDTSAYGLGSFYNQLFTQDTTMGTVLADPGYVYGIQTNRLALNPSQGLTLYNVQRNTFAQEVACMPTQVVTDAQSNSVEINNALTQHWINQKDITMIPLNQPLSADIRIRTLSETQGAFYIGIFLSNQFLDQAALQSLYNNIAMWQNTNDQYQMVYLEAAWQNLMKVNRHILNFNDKGKAFVFARSSVSDAPTLRVYEHQGAGWINTNVASVTYQTGVWYRMKFQLNGTIAMVKCWKETDQEPANWQGSYQVNANKQFAYPRPITKNTQLNQLQNINVLAANSGIGMQVYDASKNAWSTYTETSIDDVVIPAFAGSMGVITSGATVEYQVLTPMQTAKITSARQKVNESIDAQFAQQGIAAKAADQSQQINTQAMKQAQPITFGSFTLTPVSTALLANGIYIYTTNQTGLANNGTDYVVFAESITVTTIGDDTIGQAINLGCAPTKSPKAIISLVSNNAYDGNKKVLALCPGILSIYQNSFGLPSSIAQTISLASAQYVSSALTKTDFINISLTLEAGAIKNGVYIYSGSSITKNLTGSDYFVAATINASGLITPNQAYGQKLDMSSTSINGLISLVTGNVFTFALNGKPLLALSGQTASKITVTPVAGSPLYTSLLPIYGTMIDADLYQKIQQQVSAYNTAIQAQSQISTTPKPPVTPPPISKPSLPSLPSLPVSDTSTTININDAWDTGGL